MTLMTTYYLDFKYPADELEKYISAAGFFTIMLRNSDIVHYEPVDATDFEAWLDENGVTDIRSP